MPVELPSQILAQKIWLGWKSLPPLNEQKRIAAILDKADAIRRKRQQAIQLADDFLRSVFLDMFGDPVTNRRDFPLVQSVILLQLLIMVLLQKHQK
nr:hypothetical protein KXZ65_03235 [Pectobacterium sp. PL152]